MKDETNERAAARTGKEWNPASYDEKNSFVWRLGADVIELLAPKAGERILDLGCGTGHLTRKIADSGAEVIGLDVSTAMIESARTNYPDMKFELGDGMDFRFDEPFDGVFSNAAIHWMREPARVADCIWTALKPGGRFVAEFGGRGNIAKLHTAICRAVVGAGYRVSEEATFRYYPTIGEYATLLESRGFWLTHASHFDRLTPLEGGEDGLRNWMAVFGDGFLANVPPDERGRIASSVEAALRSDLYRDGVRHADYKRIRVRAIKRGPPHADDPAQT